MPAFLKSVGYVKMLAELDFLKDPSNKSDDEDSRSLDDVSIGEASGLCQFDLEDRERENLFAGPRTYTETPARNTEDCIITASISQKGNLLSIVVGRCRLSVGLFCSGVVKKGLSSHAVYAVSVIKSCGKKEVDSWTVYRRYSDFSEFHARMKEKVIVAKSIINPMRLLSVQDIK